MNKNIKDEFDNLISSQTPDLWDRIEASLPEKSNMAEQENERGQKNEQEQKAGFIKRKLYRKYAAYGTVGIAACLCIALVALNGSLKKSDPNMTANETASEEELYDVEETATDDFVTESEGDGADNGAMKEFLDTADYEDEAADADEEEGADAGSAEPETEGAVNRAEEEKYESDGVAEDMYKESLSSQKDEEAVRAVQDKIEDLLKQGYLVYQDAWIQIESVTEAEQEGESAFIYHVTILEGIDNMEKEMQLDLKVDELFHARLMEGERYRVTFYDNKMPYDSSIHEYFLLELK